MIRVSLPPLHHTRAQRQTAEAAKAQTAAWRKLIQFIVLGHCYQGQCAGIAMDLFTYFVQTLMSQLR